MASPPFFTGVVNNVFVDPTAGRINIRIFMNSATTLIGATDLTAEEKGTFFEIVLLTCKKLVAVHNHLERYRLAEDSAIEKEKNRKPRPLGVTESTHAQDLFLECDEFLMQVKSALDYLVKLPVPVFGSKRWNLATFGEKGQRVVKAFRNLPDPWKERAESVIKNFIEPNLYWIEAVVTGRDRFNHYLHGGIKVDQFIVEVSRSERGEEVVKVPMYAKNATTRKFLEDIWGHLLVFVEDFIGAVLSFREKQHFALKVAHDDQDTHEPRWKVQCTSPYGPPTGQQ